jgi:16S rRNA (adenine1518-N6/adenine1519-N6)-dimethyltransferase
VVVEIGPGRGALTDLLANRCNNLHLIEIDRDLCGALTKRYANNPLVTVHQGDVLKFDFVNLSQQLDSTLVLVGNLPYNISTALLIRLLSQLESTHEMIFMVQREIAVRLMASPGQGNYGRLTVMVGRSCEVQSLFEVDPAAFIPPPKVHSAVVRLSPRPMPLGPAVQPRLFESIVRDAFTQRRKTLRNALRQYSAEPALSTLGIDPTLRPERLSIEQFATLAAILED